MHMCIYTCTHRFYTAFTPFQARYVLLAAHAHKQGEQNRCQRQVLTVLCVNARGIHMHIDIYMYTHIYVYIHVYMYIYMYIHSHIYTCIHVYICIHIYECI